MINEKQNSKITHKKGVKHTSSDGRSEQHNALAAERAYHLLIIN